MSYIVEGPMGVHMIQPMRFIIEFIKQVTKRHAQYVSFCIKVKTMKECIFYVNSYI